MNKLSDISYSSPLLPSTSAGKNPLKETLSCPFFKTVLMEFLKLQDCVTLGLSSPLLNKWTLGDNSLWKKRIQQDFILTPDESRLRKALRLDNEDSLPEKAYYAFYRALEKPLRGEGLTRQCLLTTNNSVYVYSVALSQSGTLLASGSSDGSIHVWVKKEGSFVIHQTLEVQHQVMSVAVSESEDEEMIAAGTQDGTVYVWVRSSQERVFTRNHCFKNPDPLASVEISQEEHFILTRSQNGQAHIWQRRTGGIFEKIQLLAAFGDALGQAKVSQSEDFIVTPSWNSALIWKKEGQCFLPKSQLRGFAFPIASVAISRCGQIVVTGSSKTAHVWMQDPGTYSFKTKAVLEGHILPIMSVSISDRNLIVTGSLDHTARIWTRQKNGTITSLVLSHLQPVLSVAISPDSQSIVIGTGRHMNIGEVGVWSLNPYLPNRLLVSLKKISSLFELGTSKLQSLQSWLTEREKAALRRTNKGFLKCLKVPVAPQKKRKTHSS